MKRQQFLMAGMLFLSAIGALTVKAHVNRLPTVYGKLGGQCQALCTTSIGPVCGMTSDDGLYYAGGTCATRFTGICYSIPTN
ncbi:hypothetical protein [Chitinophaga parva]|uniref:hypothetical protein n=1 Tax=Chitinophaga parva TaxID=2169414 RepID=UPI00105718C6|nr:hypothetical protein [Chitinophaga parva]